MSTENISGNPVFAKRVADMLTAMRGAHLVDSVAALPPDKFAHAVAVMRSGAMGQPDPRSRRNFTKTAFTHLPSRRIYVNDAINDNELADALSHELAHLSGGRGEEAGNAGAAQFMQNWRQHSSIRQSIQQNIENFIQRGRSGAAASQIPAALSKAEKAASIARTKANKQNMGTFPF